MPKRLSPAEKDNNMRAWLNRMRINQVHKGVLMANQVFTMNQLFDAEATWEFDANYLCMNGRQYFVVSYDKIRNTVTVREMSNGQDR